MRCGEREWETTGGGVVFVSKVAKERSLPLDSERTDGVHAGVGYYGRRLH